MLDLSVGFPLTRNDVIATVELADGDNSCVCSPEEEKFRNNNDIPSLKWIELLGSVLEEKENLKLLCGEYEAKSDYENKVIKKLEAQVWWLSKKLADNCGFRPDDCCHCSSEIFGKCAKHWESVSEKAVTVNPTEAETQED